MLGIKDFSIALAYLLCILSAAACVVYGIVNWNREAETEQAQIQEEGSWEQEEKKIDENL
ncbi:MAG TPA: hypothetical protein DD727_06835 [Clostridiales bacterium]|nr:hypothetical protein [Clostridiales bacterium]